MKLMSMLSQVNNEEGFEDAQIDDGSLLDVFSESLDDPGVVISDATDVGASSESFEVHEVGVDSKCLGQLDIEETNATTAALDVATPAGVCVSVEKDVEVDWVRSDDEVILKESIDVKQEQLESEETVVAPGNNVHGFNFEYDAKDVDVDEENHFNANF
jgi:hypothetical protein